MRRRIILSLLFIALSASWASAQTNVNVEQAKVITDALATIDGHVDGLETLVGTSNTNLILIAGLVNSLGATTSGSKAVLVMCAVTTSAPTYTTAQSNALSCGTDGSVRVIVTSSALPTGAATGYAQASTTSGQLGTLTMGAVTTSAPTYTNAQSAPISLTTTGLTRVSVQSGGPTEVVEGSVYAAGGNVSVLGYRRCDTPSAGTGVANGDVGVPCLNAFGGQVVAIQANDGTMATIAQDRTEDTAEAGGETGPLVLGVRRDTAASSSGTSGDFSTMNLDALGRLWVRHGDPCADHARVSSAPIDTASSGNVQIVALNSGDIIYVCGYDIVTTTAVAVQFIYGTGTACATGETDISGPMPFGSNGGVSRTNAGAVQFKTAVSNALCIELSSGVQTSGYVTYVRTAAP